MHLPVKTDGKVKEVLSEHWLVKDQFAFDSISVSRSVDGTFKYLACGGCDRGPIGIVFAAAPKMFYVSHARVTYSPT